MAYSVNGNNVYYYGDQNLENITDLRSIYRQAQPYPQILQGYQGYIYQDPEFPHIENSIGNVDQLLDTANEDMAQMVAGWRNDGWDGSTTWIRITDLCNRVYNWQYTPCFNCGDIGKKSGRLDIKQGLTGDCWFLCSLSAVSMVKSLIKIVIPDDNFTNDSGVYHFRFWYQGAWVDIVVDDFIPCFVVGDKYNIVGSNFFINNQYAEFWPMLVEKAFAKLNGSYCNIASNVPMYALEALTGGFGECVMFDGGVPPHFFEDIVAWLGKDSVNSATSRTPGNGIVSNHAYSVTGAKSVTMKDYYGRDTHVQLLRLRNPWGNTEWTGSWCDSSPLWQSINQRQRDSLGVIERDDGEFWMCFEDFLHHFCDFSSATYFDHEAISKPNSQLKYTEVFDEWNWNNITAGGWDHPDQSPHYPVELSSDTGGHCLLIVSVTLQQKLLHRLDAYDNFCIRVFEANHGTRFDQIFFRTHKEVFPVGTNQAPLTGMKSYTLAFTLPAGKYVIVPNTLNEGVEKKFCLRVMNQKKSSIP